MTRLFVELPSFRNDWRALGLADGDLRRLQEELLTDPQAGLAASERSALLMRAAAKAAASGSFISTSLLMGNCIC